MKLGLRFYRTIALRRNVFALLVFLVVATLTILAPSTHLALNSVITPPLSMIIMTTTTTTTTTTESEEETKIPTAAMIQAIQDVREQFYIRYGGNERAQAMYHRGVKAFGTRNATALRILNVAAATTEKTPFVMTFAGYSVTVGRGNFFHQSYPFVVERILKPVLAATFQVDLLVRNAAIGGIPSFPYAFCFQHFFGHPSPHVISWDYNMNEDRHAHLLEAYIRHALHQLPETQPMLLALDANDRRCRTMQQYTEITVPANNGGGGDNDDDKKNAGPLLPDGMCVGMSRKILNDDLQQLLHMPDDSEEKPDGFKQWNEYGAPPTCPGRSHWHPKFQEHELVGWIVAMYFVNAIEIALEIAASDKDWRVHHYQKPRPHVVMRAKNPLYFPPPLHSSWMQEPDVRSLMYGHEVDVNGTTLFQMKPLSCRTNFLPASNKDNVLTSIVVSGLSPNASVENILQERSDAAYQAGWVLDITYAERSAKIQSQQCADLGHEDVKIGLYGMPESGTLRLWLPHSTGQDKNTTHHDDDENDNDDDNHARHWFSNFILCESNEQRVKLSCTLDGHVEYTVGGVAVTSIQMIADAGEYKKRKTCAHIGVPKNATITRFSALTNVDGTPISQETRIRLSAGIKDDNGVSRLFNDDHVGLVVDIRANARVRRREGACCLSHVVWEEH